MVPDEYLGYFIAAAGAAAALIGLLFVAISLRPDSIFGPDAPPDGQTLAGSSFTGLVNAFFISLVANIPSTNIGWGAGIVAVISLVNTVRLHRHRAGRTPARAIFLFSCAGYGFQLAVGVVLIVRPHQTSFVDVLTYIVVGSFAIALSRAWALVEGAHLHRAPKSTPAD
jgi:hypothetical protein